METGKFWQNDPNHNIEPKSGKSDVRTIPLTLDEWNKAGKSAETLRKEYFQAQADKRVDRFFLVPHGLIWLLYHISDIPDLYESAPLKYSSLYAAKDGMTTLITVMPFMSKSRAYDHIQEYMSDTVKYSPETLSFSYDMSEL